MHNAPLLMSLLCLFAPWRTESKLRIVVTVFFSLASNYNLAFAEITETQSIFKLGAWSLERSLDDGKSYCDLSYEPQGRLQFILTSEGTRVGMLFISSKWKFRKNLAPASLVTGKVFPGEGGFIVADGVTITDPHADFNKDSIYFDLPLSWVAEPILDIAKTSETALIINGEGKQLAKLSFSGARKPIEAWLKCIGEL